MFYIINICINQNLCIKQNCLDGKYRFIYINFDFRIRVNEFYVVIVLKKFGGISDLNVIGIRIR